MIPGMIMRAITGLVSGPVTGVAMDGMSAGVAIGARLGGSMRSAIATSLFERRGGPSWREMAPGLALPIAGIMISMVLAGTYIWA